MPWKKRSCRGGKADAADDDDRPGRDLGLLPAALAFRPAWDATGAFRWVEQIGSQTQRPLAIVVVGGMLTTLLLTRYLMPVLYSFYGHREPPADPAASGIESLCDWR